MPTLPVDVGFAPPPAGVTPDFGAPRVSVLFTCITFLLLVLSAGAISLRVFTRHAILHTLGTDDYFLVVAFLFAVISSAASQAQVKYGLGSHAWNVPLSNSPMYLKLFLLAVTSYMACIMFIKLSLLFLYRRMYKTGNKSFDIAWWMTTFVVVGYTIPSLLVTIFQCRPVYAAWDITLVGPGRCVNIGALYISHGVLNALTDILFLMLPIPSVWALSITRKQKMVVSLLFALGSFTCVVSIIRLTQLTGQPQGLRIDWTRGALGGSIWSLVELNCGMICASAISFRPFFRQYLGSKGFNRQFYPDADLPIYGNAEFARTDIGKARAWELAYDGHHSPSKLSDIIEDPACDDVNLETLDSQSKAETTRVHEMAMPGLRPQHDDFDDEITLRNSKEPRRAGRPKYK